MTEHRTKTVVIVVDGATFDVMRPLMERGELPHMTALMQGGASAELLSSIPFVTPTAFSCLMTGVNPGKHGLFDFTYDSHRSYDAGPVVDYTKIRTKTLWELLSEHGKRTILVTVPFTYPPTPFDGVLVSLGNVTEGRMRTYPRDLIHELLDHIGGYDEKFIRVVTEPDGRPSEELAEYYVSLCQYQAEKSKQAGLYLMGAHPWDLMVLTFVTTDRFQHYFWRFMDPRHPAYDAAGAAKYGHVIQDAYRKADADIGEILKSVPEDAHVVVISDHGFGPLDYVFYTNRWLQERGLLRLREPQREWRRHSPTLRQCLEKVGLSAVAGGLSGWLGDLPIPIVVRRQLFPESVAEAIDWTGTRAYATRWGININLRSREPLGIVESGSTYEALVEEIMRGLREVKDPRSGGPLFELVARREDIYHGPNVGEAHDILFASNRVGVVLHKDLFGPEILREITAADLGNGDHRREGILMMKGPMIEVGVTLKGPRLEDVPATLLHLMGLPVPDYMDGKVLSAGLTPEALRRHPIVVTTSASSERPSPALASGAPGGMDGEADEEEQTKAQLKALGYIN